MLTIELVAMMMYSVAPVCIQPVLDEQRIPRHAKTKDEVDKSGEGEAREQRGRRRPGRIGERRAQLPEQVEQRDNRDQRGVLEQRDKAVDEAGNDVAQRLRHYDQRGGLPPGQAKSTCRLTLPARNCL